ncbi:hypothetical protein APR04_001451 [Promicromonospora umidemergens]|uniref:Capsular polysaccharide biosynthesis protein n=1 Tax=Promicromonospora umidemergens TaxID=629679 RepID=A0ABP8Y6K1_9MICO|nr:hypothetical protein [Promicromonospora umidemergens]MCP2282553.1 hypothetical protein [Promicromonospora umidemergens]
MKFWDLVRAALRHWIVLVAGAVATLGLMYSTTLDDGVFWSRTQVVFLAPPSAAYPNSLRTTSEDLIITAGAVAKTVSGPDAVTKYASPDASLVGEGVRDGWSIRLPDTGGQWAPHFAEQVLYVEVVAATADKAAARQGEIIAQITEALDRLQRDAGVAPVNDITVTVAPESTVVHQVKGSRGRSAGMAGVLGVAATFTVIAVLEIRGRRPVMHRHRAAPRPPRSAPPAPASGPRTDP